MRPHADRHLCGSARDDLRTQLTHYVRAVNLSAMTWAIHGEMHPSETFRTANAMRFDALAMHLDAREHVEFHRSSRPRSENEARKKAFAHLSKTCE